MPNNRSHSPERKPPVVDRISVLGFHRLGAYVLSRYRTEAKKRGDGPYVPGVALEIAKKCKMSRSMVDLARIFARRYSLAEARKLVQLRTRGGMRLNRRHIVSLLFVPRRQAKSLATRCCRYDWSANRLEIEVKRLRPKRKLGGRRPLQPATRTEAVVQLIASSERWLHRYETYVTKSEFRDPLRGFGTVEKRLRRVERELKAAVELAQQRLHR